MTYRTLRFTAQLLSTAGFASVAALLAVCIGAR